jgi:hypothetical protein
MLTSHISQLDGVPAKLFAHFQTRAIPIALVRRDKGLEAREDAWVIGVAKAGWNLDQLRERAHILEKHGGVDPSAFEKLTSL